MLLPLRTTIKPRLIMKKLFCLLTVAVALTLTTCKKESYEEDVLVLLPRSEFREYCEFWLHWWDTDDNGKLSKAEAAAVTYIGFARLPGNVTSMKGIEYFTGLTTLLCYGNAITSLDVSKCTKLTVLDCTGNDIAELDVSNNVALIELNCGGNELTSLDVSNNTLLETLYCSSHLTSLDVSNNTALTKLDCSYNNLTSLDISHNTELIELDCSNTQLAALDVSNNTLLETLYCNDNQLVSLDISKNTALDTFKCLSNPGDSISKFIVTAWFEGRWSAPDYFTTDSWQYNGKEITIEYKKAD
jgi:hypothetical protein